MNDPPGESIRVVLIDAQGLFRASLGRYLCSEAGFEVVGDCGTSVEALGILNSSNAPVDVILLDFDLGNEHAGDFIPAARNAGYQGRFLIVAGAADARNSALALRLGASGVFLKTEPPERLVQAIRLVAHGDVWIDPRVIQLMASQVIDGRPASDIQVSGQLLPEREQKVLLGILEGLSNRKIGSNLGISESLVKNTIQNLFTRTGVRKRSQLVRLALEGSLGVIQLMKSAAEESSRRRRPSATDVLEPQESCS